jgi:hypothetical protein
VQLLLRFIECDGYSESELFVATHNPSREVVHTIAIQLLWIIDKYDCPALRYGVYATIASAAISIIEQPVSEMNIDNFFLHSHYDRIKEVPGNDDTYPEILTYSQPLRR